MRTYQESLKVYRDNKNTMDYAIETAKRQAKQEGINEGRQEERLEIAKEMKKYGASIDLIKKSTGLLEEQIEKL